MICMNTGRGASKIVCATSCILDGSVAMLCINKCVSTGILTCVILKWQFSTKEVAILLTVSPTWSPGVSTVMSHN